MSKARQQRRQRQQRERAQARQRAAASPTPTPTPTPEPATHGQQPAPEEQVASAIAAAVQAVDGGRAADGRPLEQLAIERSEGWTQAVSRTLVDYLRRSVTSAWQRGWQPSELARQAGRERSAAHAAVVADMITAEMLGYPAATVDERWAAQAAALEAAAPGNGAWWGSDAEYLRARYALGRDAEFIFTVATAVETLHLLGRLPALERLLPLPGTARTAGPAASTARTASTAPADQRMLSRIRSLLAKAESTEFAQEAEALSARAQELMATYRIDHALLAAASGGEQAPGGRRIAVDNPYEAAKVTLLQTVARANRCRVVWSKEVGLVTVIGFPADLDAVELLFTSLLVQADAAMLRAGGKQDGGGRSRTRAFRTSFLVSYAVRIGERLAAAAGQAEQAAAAEQRAAGAGGRGTDLVPFLAAREQAVDSAVAEMFAAARLTRGRAVRVSDAEGWASGRVAADLASLRNQDQVRR